MLKKDLMENYSKTQTQINSNKLTSRTNINFSANVKSLFVSLLFIIAVVIYIFFKAIIANIFLNLLFCSIMLCISFYKLYLYQNTDEKKGFGYLLWIFTPILWTGILGLNLLSL